MRSLLVVVALAACHSTSPRAPEAPRMRWGLVMHAGAGAIPRDKLTPEREAAIRADLERALRAAHAVLAKGGSSLDAVTAGITILEDSPYFNAGKGAVFTHDGINELDAAIMYGPTHAAGAVAGVRTIKNPILLARAVMEKSRHVMMVGSGAEEFAATVGVERVDPSYFRTEERWQDLQNKLKEDKFGADDRLAPRASEWREHPAPNGSLADKFGTVGIVALDQHGAIAAGTSTGGLTNKRYGRVGDSPIIGAGTYADANCGVSATGHGEVFIRYTVARDVCARVEYAGARIGDAAQHIIDELARVDGDGGVIALDREGHFAQPFNTPGMYRGYIGDDGVPHIAIYK